MSSKHQDGRANPDTTREVRLEDLIGREVLAANNRPIGRLEECRTEMRGQACVVMEYVIGMSGLMERLGLGIKLIFGKKTGGHIARWDQLDISDPERPRLTCSVAELRTLK
jgi:hypothetical protein